MHRAIAPVLYPNGWLNTPQTSTCFEVTWPQSHRAHLGCHRQRYSSLWPRLHQIFMNCERLFRICGSYAFPKFPASLRFNCSTNCHRHQSKKLALHDTRQISLIQLFFSVDKNYVIHTDDRVHPWKTLNQLGSRQLWHGVFYLWVLHIQIRLEFFTEPYFSEYHTSNTGSSENGTCSTFPAIAYSNQYSWLVRFILQNKWFAFKGLHSSRGEIRKLILKQWKRSLQRSFLYFNILNNIFFFV